MIKITMNGITFECNSIDEMRAIKEMFGNTAASQSTKKPTASEKKEGEKKEGKKEVQKKAAEKTVEISDFEPKKDSNGYYRWDSYRVCRACFAYALQNVPTWRGEPKKDSKAYKSIDWDKFNEDKKLYEQTFKYTKKGDR